MLYDILIIFLLAVITALLIMVLIETNIHIQLHTKEKKPFKKHFTAPKIQESEADRKARIEFENIENYGTNKPQREIK